MSCIYLYASTHHQSPWVRSYVCPWSRPACNSCHSSVCCQLFIDFVFNNSLRTAGKYLQVATYAILLYDHCEAIMNWFSNLPSLLTYTLAITFDNEVALSDFNLTSQSNVFEVERIWKRKLSGINILFVLNRYLTPIQFSFIIDGKLFFHESENIHNLR